MPKWQRGTVVHTHKHCEHPIRSYRLTISSAICPMTHCKTTVKTQSTLSQHVNGPYSTSNTSPTTQQKLAVEHMQYTHMYMYVHTVMYMYMYSAYIRTCILIHMQYTDILLCTYSNVHVHVHVQCIYTYMYIDTHAVYRHIIMYIQ